MQTQRHKKYLCTHETTETDSKWYSVHARPVSGAVILPQRYTKNGEDMRINFARCIQTQHNNKEKHGTMHLLHYLLIC